MFSDSDGLVGGDFLQTKYDACSVMSLVSAGAAMAILFSFDTLSFLITVICVWKFSKVNMLQEFCRMIGKYWYFMAVNLAQLVVNYIVAIDVTLEWM